MTLLTLNFQQTESCKYSS